MEQRREEPLMLWDFRLESRTISGGVEPLNPGHIEEVRIRGSNFHCIAELLSKLDGLEKITLSKG